MVCPPIRRHCLSRGSDNQSCPILCDSDAYLMLNLVSMYKWRGESLGVNSTPGTKGPVYGVNTASRVPVGALHTAPFSLRRRSEMEGTSNTRLIEWKDQINQQPSSITTTARYSSDSFDQRLERKLRTCDRAKSGRVLRPYQAKIVRQSMKIFVGYICSIGYHELPTAPIDLASETAWAGDGIWYLPQTMEDLMPYSVSFYGDISFPLLLLSQINQVIIPVRI
eukprot:scaffold2901_cov91-Skeletonema_dohrnii-CCMP3373.AAC.15